MVRAGFFTGREEGRDLGRLALGDFVQDHQRHDGRDYRRQGRERRGGHSSEHRSHPVQKNSCGCQRSSSLTRRRSLAALRRPVQPERGRTLGISAHAGPAPPSLFALSSARAGSANLWVWTETDPRARPRMGTPRMGTKDLGGGTRRRVAKDISAVDDRVTTRRGGKSPMPEEPRGGSGCGEPPELPRPRRGGGGGAVGWSWLRAGAQDRAVRASAREVGIGGRERPHGLRGTAQEDLLRDEPLVFRRGPAACSRRSLLLRRRSHSETSPGRSVSRS